MEHLKKYLWVYILISAGLVAIWYFLLRNKENKIDADVKGKYLVLRAYNTEGGFFWHIYNILCASHEARKRNMKLIVLFDSGLYLETNPVYKQEYSDYIKDNNWFHYYFEPIGADIPEIKALIDSGKLNHKTKIRSLSKYATDSNKRNFYEFDRSMFTVRDGNVNYSQEWNKCLYIKQHIQDKVYDFYDKNMDGFLTIAVHRRGTDKYPHHSDNEDGPMAIEYQWIADKIQHWIDNDSAKVNKNKLPISVLVCSDEQPFIDFIFNKFGDKYKVIFTDSIRSDISTSGKHLQTCKSDFDNSPDCIEYKKMKDYSIHKGLKHLSAYKKGQDAIIDVMLMSMCNGVFFRSRGNFSSAVNYANPNLQSIDMVEKYLN